MTLSADLETPALPGLLANPFAVLGATPRTPVDELFELADTPEATAAARALSVPRSRLAAEASFLPGAADRAAAILNDLRAGRRPDPGGLPPLAAANLRAHLCAAGPATPDDLHALATGMPAGADPALVAALDADRAAIGMPPVQQAALAEAVEALTDGHAGALVTACLRTPEPARFLASLIEAAPPGRPPPLLRRAAAAWTRRTATLAAGLQATADGAVAAWRSGPDPATAQALETALRGWTGATRPQRLVDARAALDHPATVRALAVWRAAVRQVAGQHPAEAAWAARLLADLFGDLPGEGPSLLAEARNAAAAHEAQVLGPHLERVRALVARLSADVLPLRAQLATRPFGPGSRKAAGELWAAFDAAVAASPASDLPWTEVLKLAPLLDAPPRPGRARGVASLYDGLAARAEAAGRTDLAARLRATLRERRADAAVELYERRKAGWRFIPALLAPVRHARVSAAARRALALVDDPATRRRIEAEQAARRKRRRWLVGTVVALAVLAFLGEGVVSGDEEYAAHAPYRTRPPISLATPARAPPMPLPIPPAPLTAPKPVRTFAFPPSPGETDPGPGGGALTRSGIRWCLDNAARLQAANDLAMPEDEPGLRALDGDLLARCNHRSVRRLDEDAVHADVERDGDRLRTEGEAMLRTTP